MKKKTTHDLSSRLNELVSTNRSKRMNKVLTFLLLTMVIILMWSTAEQVYALDYSSFNSSYPVSVYYPYSSNKANNLGTYILINNVKNDYTNPIAKEYLTSDDGQLTYIGLTTSSNKYYSWDGTSINNSGTISGPDPIAIPGEQAAVQLPVPPETITSSTGETKTLYFNYYVVQVVPEDVRWSTVQTLGTNYAMQPLDVLPTNANFAWAYYSDSPGAVIYYVTTDGTVLVESPTIIGELDDSVESEVLSFDGYELVQIPEATTFSETKQTLTYVYKKIETEDSSTEDSSSEDSSTSTSGYIAPTLSSSTDETSTFSNEPNADEQLPQTGTTNSSLLLTVIGSIVSLGISFYRIKNS